MRELRAGTSEESLIADSLSIQRLFERDLAGLGPKEESALRQVAKDAPVQVSEILERVAPEVIQTLVDQRLIVRVGERLDTYWDTFRDFLNSGRVNVADTYILRQNPAGTSRLARLLASRRGGVTLIEAAKQLNTSVNTVSNVARDLRQLGVVVARDGVYAFRTSVKQHATTEDAIREQVASALRRHRLYQVVAEHTKKLGKPFPIQDIALELNQMFPAVSAEPRTWLTYARAFARWFSYANLFELRGQELSPPGKASAASLLLGKGGGRQKTFPQGRPTQAIALLASMCGDRKRPRLTKSSREKAENDLTVLGLISEGGVTIEGQRLFNKAGLFRMSALRSLLSTHASTAEAIKVLEDDPRVDAAAVGESLRKSQGAGWAKTTTNHAGALVRAWAKAAGVRVERPHRLRQRGAL